MQPDLCITAAYGNYLPTSFLKIPHFGTLNIHPSLLPKFRGAAPVQRALESGLSTTGVTVLYTVKEMDAGPILAQKEVQIDDDIQAPQLLHDLFVIGTDLLLYHLPRIWSGEASQDNAQAQDASQATHAAKIEKQEGILDFSSQSAYMCHSKVKGFAGWPGTVATFYIQASDSNYSKTNDDALDLKIIKTKVVDASLIAEDTWRSDDDDDDDAKCQAVAHGKQGLLVKCGDGSVLQIIEVQPPGKKPMSARSFANGLKGRKLYWKKK
jgi:methionyl-tRNA formyltransferase